MGNEIKIQELIDVENAITALERMNNSLRDMVDLLDVKLRKSSKGLNEVGASSAQGLKEVNTELITSEKLLQERLKTEKLSLSIEKEKEKIRNKELKDAQNKNNAYKQESARLNELRNAYKNLAVAGRENGVVARGILTEISKLDSKLKSIDASVGQFQRNVGNYSSAMDGFKNKIVGFGKDIALSLGAAFGAGGLIEFGKDSVGAFLEAEENANKLAFAVKNIANGNDGAVDILLNQSAELQKKSIFSDDDIQKAQTALVQLGLTTNEVEKLIPKIIDLASAQGTDLASSTDTIIKALNGQTKGLKEVGLGFENTKTITGNYNVILQKLDKFQGAANASMDTHAGKLARVKNAWDDVKETVGEWLVNYADDVLHTWDVLTGKVDAADSAIRHFSGTFDRLAQSFVAGGAGRQNAIAVLQNLNREIKELTASGDIEKANEKYKVYINLLERIKKLQNKDEGGVQLGRTKEEDKTEKDASEKVMKEKISNEETWLDYHIRSVKAQFKAEQELRELKEKNEQERKKELEDIEKGMRLVETDPNVLTNDPEFKRYQKEKELREQRLKELEEYAVKSLDLIEKELQKENEMRRKALDEQINERESAINIQAQRAANGLDNTLEFERKKLAEQQLEKEALAKKEKRQEKEIAFLKLLAGYAKDDPNTALRKAFVDMALSTAISAAFWEGTENVGESLGKPHLPGRDGYVVRVDGSERVMTGEQNRLVGDMSNEDLARLAYDYRSGKLLPDTMLNVPSRHSLANNISESVRVHQMVSPLINEIRDLKAELKRKPVTSIGADELGNMVVTTVSDGMKKVVKHIKSKPSL